MTGLVRGAFSCALLILLMSCNDLKPNRVEVSIVNARDSAVGELSRVTVISGGDKFAWPQVGTGEEVSVSLDPGLNSDAQVTLLYTSAGKARQWESRSLAPQSGYRVVIRFGRNEQPEADICVLPC